MARRKARNSRDGRRRNASNADSPIESFLALPDAEKQRQVAAFDREFAADAARPLTPAQRRLWRKAKRKPGR